jgi:hypothetical protein
MRLASDSLTVRRNWRYSQVGRSMFSRPYTYRGEPVTHFVNPQTGLHIMRGADGAFVSGWHLTTDQLANVLARGSL